MQVSTFCFDHMSCKQLPVGHTARLAQNVKTLCYLSGKQAEVLNILLEDLLEGHAVSETKLKEVLGHTPIKVRCLKTALLIDSTIC